MVIYLAGELSCWSFTLFPTLLLLSSLTCSDSLSLSPPLCSPIIYSHYPLTMSFLICHVTPALYSICMCLIPVQSSHSILSPSHHFNFYAILRSSPPPFFSSPPYHPSLPLLPSSPLCLSSPLLSSANLYIIVQ